MDYKHIHIKKIDSMGEFSVWLVDGGYIRKNVNENFVAFDGHHHFKFIPQNEIWIEYETDPDDRPFFIDNLLVEMEFMNSGDGYKEAHNKANLHEKKQREESPTVKKLSKLNHHRGKLITRIHKELLTEYGDGIKVWLVDGILVRDFFLVEYSMGGHDRVYSFIPKNEVWIEHVLSVSERKFIILHELHERYLMGAGKNYKDAHYGATIIEDYFRDYPKGIDKRIKEEIKKNN